MRPTRSALAVSLAGLALLSLAGCSSSGEAGGTDGGPPDGSLGGVDGSVDGGPADGGPQPDAGSDGGDTGAPCSATWRVESMPLASTNTDDVADLSAALDTKGDVHVAYSADITGVPQRYVAYVIRDAQGWSQAEMLDASGIQNAAVAMDLDTNDGVHVAYTAYGSGANDALTSAYRAAGQSAWTRVPIDTTDNVQGGLSVAVDPSAGTHVSYGVVGDGGAPQWAYAYQAPQASSFTQPTSLGGNGVPVLRADAQGGVYGAAFGTYYHLAPGGSWTSESIPVAVSAVSSDRLAVDAAGVVYVTLLEQADGGSQYTLRVAERSTSGTWTTSSIADAAIAPAPITVDATGTIHVVYTDGSTVQHATRAVGGTWTTEKISDVFATSSAWPAFIGVDASGGVHVVYTSGSMSPTYAYHPRCP